VTATLRRRLLFGALYFSEGAPIGFLWWAMPARLRAAGLEVDVITGLLGVLVLPWALKFLAAPFVDVLRSPGWPLRAWIAAAQVTMGLLLLPLLWLDWRAQFGLIGLILLLHAIAAAIQDVAVDAYALAVVEPDHRASINAWMQIGMLSGRSLFGGGALLLDARFGTQATVLLLIGAIWSSLTVLALAGEPEPGRGAGTDWRRRGNEFRAALGEVLCTRTTWLVLGFAAIGGAGYEAVGLLVGPYLVDRSFTQTEIGAFLFLPTVAAMMLGALVAGTIADALDHAAAAAVALTAMAITIVALAAVDAAAPAWVVLAALLALYVLIGAYTTISYALFMDRTDRRLGATQLSAYMSGTNLCESWSAMAGGRLVTSGSYATAFVVMAMASLAALPLLGALRAGRSRSA
jgi:hypothetical protein